MKKAWTDLKSFITVMVILLFAYTVIRQIPMGELQTQITMLVVGAFIGSKSNKKEGE